MRRRVVSVLWTLVLFLVISTNAQLLPYNPTTILLPSSASAAEDVAYIFLEASQSDTRSEFVFLNISTTISTSNLTLQSFSPNLPFLTNGTAYVPAISSSGVITVYTGSCSSPADNELWVFTITNGSAGNGSWAKQAVDISSDATSAGSIGAEFLAGAFSFSTIVDANATLTDIYMYGGMCPNASTTVSTWQSAGLYSNRMLRLTPQASDSAYTLDVATNRGAPVAEAGFTITGLTPTYSNASGIMTQARNYILLGGHTKTAFINMSQVAIWSLPEESWSFVTVDPPSASEGSNTELAVKSAVANVDSRSGHTAILTEDGSSVIVLGGWVGDVNQAADPQLAVLKLGTGFGGTGDWIWSIPSNQPSGDGIFGHGAVMLPGNVMMVVGGFNITASANAKRAINSDNRAMFFNATSMEWTSNYTNPSYLAALNHKSDTSSSSNSRDIGLGIGLGIGLVVLLALIWLAVRWLIRSRGRKMKRHEAREKDLRALSFGAAAAYSAPEDMSQSTNGAYAWSNNRWRGNYHDNHEDHADSTSAVAGYQRLQTGEYGPVESVPAMKPRQISRKPLRSARGAYQPTPTFDPGPAAVGHVRNNSLGTAGAIHPIYEADEDADPISPIGVGVALPLGETSMASAPLITVSKRQSDPFRDPRPLPYNFSTPLKRDNRSTSAPTPESPVQQEREREIEAWVADWAAADALLNAQARSHSNADRLSPTRRVQLIAASGPSSVAGDLSEDSGRTASNLSERTIATLSRSGSSSQGTRSNSLLGYINHALNTITAGGVPLSPTPDNLSANKGRPPGSSGSETASTFNTAHSSFPSLQAEASTLLPRPDATDRSNYSPTRTPSQSPTRETFDYIGSPSKNKPNGLSRRGILGSIRRVFSAESDDYDEPFAAREPAPLPIEPDNTPRRAVSASATLWRRKQGKIDWEDSAKEGRKTTRSNTVTGERPNLHARTGGAKSLVQGMDEDEEWDIERAVEDRVVQVMFTVPREKLRVVNHDVMEDISEAGSVGGRSRTVSASGTLSRKGSEVLSKKESMRSLKRMESLESGDGASNSSLRGKGKGKVSELVERLEGRSTPERGGSPERR
ncbi:galactose oxidase protein [Rutstroemia sp. NJR-2017a BVV2]|nr:galactose oxidase protein [Rutstroemia sp. NJR-2017a BVV2]